MQGRFSRVKMIFRRLDVVISLLCFIVGWEVSNSETRSDAIQSSTPPTSLLANIAKVAIAVRCKELVFYTNTYYYMMDMNLRILDEATGTYGWSFKKFANKQSRFLEQS